MVNFEFHKYQGTGNDFIIIQGIKELPVESVQRLCDRRFGIGADGLILMNKSKKYHFDMLYYNSDGSKSFCGNGSRCAVQYARHMGWIGDECLFYSNDGEHSAYIKDQWVYLKMHDVDLVYKDGSNYELDTGSPHYIVYHNSLDELQIIREARKIRYSEKYRAEGINVNFVCNRGGALHIRTYERGVEDETLSCGTGVTASAIANYLELGVSEKSYVLKVKTMGGELEVRFEVEGNRFHNIFLCGPGEYVFRGKISLD